MPVDVEVVAAAVAACPSVARLYGGRVSEVATYLPGRRVEGVKLGEEQLEVHVVAAWDVPLPQVADEVRGAATPVGGGLPVDVYIDDVDIPPALLGAEESPEESLPGSVGRAVPPPPGATLPGEVVEPSPGAPPPAVGLPGDPVLDPLATDPLTSESEADLLLSQTGPVPTRAQADPAADVLPGEITPDDPVLEDEVPGDVIPGEPVPLPSSEAPKKKRTSKKGGGGSR
ncbi:MAG: hypothetical protein M3333_08950 [Actinomycetota bacterium]|nr:hypothetical protein [Actinomycetota bacterium]